MKKTRRNIEIVLIGLDMEIQKTSAILPEKDTKGMKLYRGMHIRS